MSVFASSFSSAETIKGKNKNKRKYLKKINLKLIN